MAEPSRRLLLRTLPSITLCALLALSRLAFATVGTPVLQPSQPRAGELVSVVVFAGGCDAFSDDPPPQVTRISGTVRIVLSAVSSIDPFCVFPAGASKFPVGTFGAGTYRLQVDRTYAGFFGQTTETLGVLRFEVAAMASVPALDDVGAPALIALLSLVAGYGRMAALTATPADRATRCLRHPLRESAARARR